MTGNREDGGTRADRVKTALSGVISNLRTVGSEAFAAGKEFKDNVVDEFGRASDTLAAEINGQLARNAEDYGRLHESLALKQGETPHVAARIRDYMVRNHPIYGTSTPSNDKGGPSGPGPGAGAVG